MRTLVLFFAALLLQAQTDTPQSPAAPAPIRIEVAPLAPPDLESPYASPRDAARHRSQVTLANLESTRDVKTAMRGFAEAFKTDRTYAAAAWNLGILAAVQEKWADAIGALSEAARQDPSDLGKTAAPQIERLRLVASMSKTPEGTRKLRYDAALYPAVSRLGQAAPAESMAAIAEVGRIDPKRWEAPALLAGLNGDGHGYDAAAKFLEIAIANTSDPSVKAALEKALGAARRELSYAEARAAADNVAFAGEYGKAAELYDRAWSAIPARAANGMEAAADYLAADDTLHAARTLRLLRKSGDSELSTKAGQMLDEIKAIEPAATEPEADATAFFQDRGPADPVRIQDLLPRLDTSAMEILARPLPRLLEDSEPVVLLQSLDAGRAKDALPVSLPELPPAGIAGDHPWSELQAVRPPAPKPSAERSLESAELPGNPRNRRLLAVTTQPGGARIFVGDAVEPLCQSPCDIKAPIGEYRVRAELERFEWRTEEIRVSAARNELNLVLSPSRGSILIEAPAGSPVRINGTPVSAALPVEVSLAPGLYRISMQNRDQFVTVKPDSHLRLNPQP